MMMIPRRKNEFDLIGDLFRDPFFTDHESNVMKTDIKEKSDKYLIDIELPGYEKDSIKIDIDENITVEEFQTLLDNAKATFLNSLNKIENNEQLWEKY